ncbi:MAG: hypothetical protein HYY16_03085 [Planctomycetes bacterium]|nr:hypothetical protein [Planctomycetota bacterium]
MKPVRYGILCVVLAAGCEKPPPIASVPPAPPPAIDVQARVREARSVVRRHAVDVEPVLDLANRRVEEFFAARFARTDAFVDELFSFRGKWRSMFWGREDYERWVRRAFERRLMSEEDFEREVLVKVREDFSYAWGATENRVLADVHTLVRSDVPKLDFEPFAAQVGRLAADLLPGVAADTAMNVVTLAASEGASTAAMSGLALVGIGAANSWWNFGIGLVVGVVAGIVVDAVVGEVAEDEARMRVHAELVLMRRRAADEVVRVLVEAWRAHLERQEEVIAGAVVNSLQ